MYLPINDNKDWDTPKHLAIKTIPATGILKRPITANIQNTNESISQPQAHPAVESVYPRLGSAPS